jgi:caa(3)-type oxidase subunit IV
MSTRRLDVIWILLLALTAVTWWLGERGATGATAVLVMLSIAAVKGSLVALDFMTLRAVKRQWPLMVVGWLVVVLVIIAAPYAMGLPKGTV